MTLIGCNVLHQIHLVFHFKSTTVELKMYSRTDLVQAQWGQVLPLRIVLKNFSHYAQGYAPTEKSIKILPLGYNLIYYSLPNIHNLNMLLLILNPSSTPTCTHVLHTHTHTCMSYISIYACIFYLCLCVQIHPLKALDTHTCMSYISIYACIFICVSAQIHALKALDTHK